jgi:hypothetical protein
MDGISSNCIFFADDGNLHAMNKIHLQKLLDIICTSWSSANGMEFAADKCYVVANEKIEAKMSDCILPQVEETKYFWVFLLMLLDLTGSFM